MTNEEYAMLRSIAAADCTEGPNFDPSLLAELLDVFDAFERVQAERAQFVEVTAKEPVVGAVERGGRVKARTVEREDSEGADQEAGR